MILSKNNQHQIETWLNDLNSTGGAVLLDKQIDWTSFDVVAKLRKIIHIKKIGHTGTLDPKATGLLILCLGKMTKEIFKFQDLPKTYSAIIKLGATTKTDDSEAPEENIIPINDINIEDLISVIKSFQGKIIQVPPVYSAKRIDGVKMYNLARKSIDVIPKPVEIEVFSTDNIEFEQPFVKFDVSCSKGTYIRAIARDIGIRLGTGGYLAGLRRTAIGSYNVSDAFTIQELESLIVTKI